MHEERCGFFLAPNHQCPNAATHVSDGYTFTERGKVYACHEHALVATYRGWPIPWLQIGDHGESPVFAAARQTASVTERSPPLVGATGG